MRRMASAPAARASWSWIGSTVKSLRRTGTPMAARAARRSASDPSKYGPSVSTDRAAAPPAA